MAAIGMIGIESKVSISPLPAGANTYVQLVGVSSMELPNPETEEIDTTHYGSPNRTREFISGLSDAGEVSVEMNWIPGSPTDVLLSGYKASGESVNLKFEIGKGTANTYLLTETWTGFVKGYERTPTMDDKMTSVLTFRVSSKV